MLSRTHIAIGIFFAFLLLPSISHPLAFSVTLLISSLLPDIDSPISFLGKYKFFSVLQTFLHHRGVLHSLTTAVILSLVVSIIFPTLALGFFLGYAVHLIADSFTIEGIAPFWPLRGRLSWKLKTGGYTENVMLVIFIMFDILLIIRYFS
ncbi:metal-dependent hydrolase [Candidatus Pacearchaeota archaeon]|nr:metal-dependent hydrolase [Candidatus Pacearchaeota archaeon]